MFRSLLFLYAVEQPCQVSTFHVQFLSFCFFELSAYPKRLGKEGGHIHIFSCFAPGPCGSAPATLSAITNSLWHWFWLDRPFLYWTVCAISECSAFCLPVTKHDQQPLLALSLVRIIDMASVSKLVEVCLTLVNQLNWLPLEL